MIAQFYSMEDPWLELVGFYEKENKESPASEDCNAVIINWIMHIDVKETIKIKKLWQIVKF